MFGNIMNKRAFTLSETLITIGIIGVAAAITLPSIVSKTEGYILKQQFKKAYSTLQNAQLRIYADTGSYYACYYYSGTALTTQIDCKAMEEHLKNILNPIKICEGNAYTEGCIPKYKGIDTVILEDNPDADISVPLKNCPGFTESSILNKNETWVLKDGTIIGWYKYNQTNYGPLIYIDTNGQKKPNKWGYDIFSLIWYGNEKRVWLSADSVCSRAEKGGKSTAEMLRDVWE